MNEEGREEEEEEEKRKTCCFDQKEEAPSFGTSPINYSNTKVLFANVQNMQANYMKKGGEEESRTGGEEEFPDRPLYFSILACTLSLIQVREEAEHEHQDHDGLVPHISDCGGEEGKRVNR